MSESVQVMREGYEDYSSPEPILVGAEVALPWGIFELQEQAEEEEKLDAAVEAVESEWLGDVQPEAFDFGDFGLQSFFSPFSLSGVVAFIVSVLFLMNGRMRLVV